MATDATDHTLTANQPPLAGPPSAPGLAGYPEEENHFRYGWRLVTRTAADGTSFQDQIPLTAEDVLYPQENDIIPERPLQEQERGYLSGVFRTRLSRLPGGVVFEDCLIDWGVPGVRATSPDVSVFEGLTVPHDPRRGTLRLVPSGGRCLLAIELVSPDPELRRNNVVHKLDVYYRAGVPLYIIVDEPRADGPRQVRAFRYTPQGFEPVPPDDQGRILIQPLGVLLGLRDDVARCWDADTGEELGDYAQVTQALHDEVEARQAAERRASEEAEARQLMEQRLRQLETELRRLRGDDPSGGPG